MEKNADLISIIVPVYQAEPHLARCLASILNQTYQNLQVILIDDGSKDGSGRICDKYACLYSRVKVIHQENRGLSCARNVGICCADGEYICFVDSDDVIAPNYAEHLHMLCKQYNADISMGQFQTFSGDLDFQQFDSEPEIISNREAVKRSMIGPYLPYVVVWNKMYHRSLLRDIRFPEGLIHEDEATTFRFYYLSNRVVVSENVIYGYFQNAQSITHVVNPQKKRHALQASALRMNYFRDAGEQELYAIAISRYAIMLYEHIAQNKERNYLVASERKQLQQEYRKMVRMIFNYRCIPFRVKIGLLAFQIFPFTYYIYKKHIK